MISCKLILVTRNSRGQAIHEEREISGDSLRIGRGANCILHLPDPRINLYHASIQYAEDGKLYLESAKELLNFNGELRKREALRAGSNILIGPYRLSVEQKDNNHDLVLSYELILPLSDDGADLKKRSRIRLAQTGLSKRLVALGLAALIALVFLILPVLNATNPELVSVADKLPVTLDESWNPGPISASHQAFAKDCQQCHTKPFVQVEDQACTKCHQNIGDHVADKTMQSTLFGETRCASCHLEHKESHAIAQSNPALCVECHGDLKMHRVNNPAIALNDIHDFSTDHPSFKLSIKTGASVENVLRIEQSSKTASVENSGLTFPHDVHLSAEGINSPSGRVNMQCSNCHVPDEAGVRFKEISMETHCASCHRLEFEPAVTTRQVPHGKVADVMTSLREFYGSQSIGQTPIDVATIDGLLRRPANGQAKAQQTRADIWAKQKANAIASDLFEVRVCKTCHEVTRTENDLLAPWKITPVNITQHWLPKNSFAHNQHSNSQCATCHNTASSKSSRDISIPDITTCRSCHGGATPVRNRVTSTCESCHGFHLPQHAKLSTKDIELAPTETIKKTRGLP
jgi:predicted CXXCH cytochrome family protein